MLPSLSPLSSGDSGPTQVPSPPRFRAPVGIIRDVVVSTDRDYSTAKGNTAARQNGLRYENKVQRYLGELFTQYIPGPQIRFVDNSGPRLCIPDGILPTSSGNFVFEIKIQHMPEAWWQLERLYRPVLETALGGTWHSIEVVKSYDPSMPFPCRVELIDNLNEYMKSCRARRREKTFGVFRWRP